MNFISKNKLLAIFLISILSSSLKARVQVYPLRVFLDQRSQGQEITVRNTASKPGSYRINTALFLQTEDGQMSVASENYAYDKDLSKNVRFSPRVVQLGPGESQTVRLFVRNVASLPEGDYRTHLRFEQTLESFQENLEKKDYVTEGQIKTGLEARVAISIPIYYRKGSPAYDLKLEALSVNIDRKNLENSNFAVTMINSGNAFPYGSLNLYVLDGTGEKLQIGTVNGAQSFISKRRFIYPISDINTVRPLIESQGTKTFVLEFKSSRDNEEEIIISTSTEA